MTTFSYVNLDTALHSVSPVVRQAFEKSHEALADLGIPHVLIGGLAINAYGYHYSTKDVDYLVLPEDAFTGSTILSHRPGVPFQVDGVSIDYVTPRADYPLMVQKAMRRAIEAARSRQDRLTVVEDWLLVWMKLNAGRTKDLAAVEGLLEHGRIDAKGVLQDLRNEGSGAVVARFERCMAEVEGR